MIEGVGKSGPGRIDAARQEKGAAAVAAPQGGPARCPEGPVKSAVFELVSAGAPVDKPKVAAIRAAIAEGRYPVDADRIAARMIALDLPRRA